MQRSPIQELMLYKFELGHNIVEVTKIFMWKVVHHSSVTRGLKKFHLDCKNLDNYARSGRL